MGEVLNIDDTISQDPEVAVEAYDNLWNGRGSPAAQHERNITPITLTDDILVDTESEEESRR